MTGRTVTIAEVARHAGVAVSTVSYVLSGKRAISADTRRRVLDSVRALGYHPNAGARVLASKRANVIALVLPLRAGMHVPVLKTCVDLDFAAAGALCVAHLAERGHREVALLGAPSVVYERGTGFARRTLEGFTAALERHGLDGMALPCEETFEEVRASVTGLLEARPGLSGLVVHNEAAVKHVLSCLRELGRRVPEDIAVVAICPDDVAGCRSEGNRREDVCDSTGMLMSSFVVTTNRMARRVPLITIMVWRQRVKQSS
ncbi:LacI family DNA-binding transcriptional regulator [Nonomuraea sp. NPDC048916]|uniref:LacI family DNA-binding transcriptional regulator n=1 Tax=Nonomuraea sp. NPDC048916 TaxID=3154232 RepID=UPI0033C844AB